MSRVNFTEAQIKAKGLRFSEPVLNTKIDFRKPCVFDGKENSHLFTDEHGQWESADTKEAFKVNKKVLNATKVEIDGIYFASKIEAYAYNLFKVLKLDFEFQVTYVLKEKFKYNGKTIREAKIIIDFYFSVIDWIVDTKGHQTAKNKLQFKLLKNKLKNEGRSTQIHLPSTKEEVEQLANKILSHGKV